MAKGNPARTRKLRRSGRHKQTQLACFAQYVQTAVQRREKVAPPSRSASFDGRVCALNPVLVTGDGVQAQGLHITQTLSDPIA